MLARFPTSDTRLIASSPKLPLQIAFQWDNMTHSLGTIPALGECSEYEPLLGASDNGNFSMVPADAGTTVYASGVPGDCDAGMQIVVVVIGRFFSSDCDVMAEFGG